MKDPTLNPFDLLQDADPKRGAMAADEGETLDLIKKCIAEGFDLGTVDKYGGTLLIAACDWDLSKIALYLIEAGSDIHFKEKQMQATPIFFAAGKGMFDVVVELAKRGAKIDEPTSKGFTPLLQCCAHMREAHLLSPKEYDSTGKEIKNSKRVEGILEGYKNYERTAEFLIEHGAKVNAKSKAKQQSGVTFTAEGGDVETLKLLLKKGAEVSPKDYGGLIPLHYACRAGQLECVKILLKHGANPNEKDNYGFTPLHEAADNNNPEVVTFLLDHGADRSIGVDPGYERYTHKETALDMAKARGHKKVIEVLV